MNIKNIFNLEINHIAIVINTFERKKFKSEFIFDKIQGVHVLFEYSELNKCYTEYITREGRAKNYKCGYNHICFNIENNNKFMDIHNTILKEDLGFRLTLPEKSISKYCNFVTFYNLKIFGITEFNIKNFSD